MASRGECAASGASAETIGGALTKAYLNNPDINTQRATVRAADEAVPQANSGYLPPATANLNGGVSSTYGQDLGSIDGSVFKQTSLPRGYGVQVQENVWNGNKTFNSVRAAESAVFAARETLRGTEEQTLFNALTGSRQKVANYPGVTVERKEGAFVTPRGRQVSLLDLPGTYSLRGRSPDEEITRDIVLGKVGGEVVPDLVLCVADSTNLRLTIRLLLELKSTGRPLVLVLNMFDIASRRGAPSLVGVYPIPALLSRRLKLRGRRRNSVQIDSQQWLPHRK